MLLPKVQKLPDKLPTERGIMFVGTNKVDQQLRSGKVSRTGRSFASGRTERTLCPRSLPLLKLRRHVQRSANAARLVQPDIHDRKPLIVVSHHAHEVR